jgi:hypothetical protein
MLRNHSGEGEGLLVVREALVLVGLGRLQDLLQEGLLIIAGGDSWMVLRPRLI